MGEQGPVGHAAQAKEKGDGAVNVSDVRRDDWILAGIALLLAIALLFFPWFSISASFGGITVSADFTATGAPDGWVGVLAMLCAVAVIVDLAMERLTPQTTVPSIGGSRETTRFALAVAAAAFVALKFVLHIHFSLFGWGFYLSVILVAALVFLANQARQGVPFAIPSRLQNLGGGSVASASPGAGPASAGAAAPSAGPAPVSPPPPPPAEPPDPPAS